MAVAPTTAIRTPGKRLLPLRSKITTKVPAPTVKAVQFVFPGASVSTNQALREAAHGAGGVAGEMGPPFLADFRISTPISGILNFAEGRRSYDLSALCVNA